MTFDRLFNLAASIVTLAMVTVFVTSPNSSKVINAVGNSFGGVLKAATLR